MTIIDIKEQCADLIAEIQEIANEVNVTHKHPVFDARLEAVHPKVTAEMHANITLAYRHLEDAKTRLEKMIQVYEST